MRVYKIKSTNRIVYFRMRRQSAVAFENTRVYDFFYAYIHTLITLVPRLKNLKTRRRNIKNIFKFKDGKKKRNF
jgi:hypothetical protein